MGFTGKDCFLSKEYKDHVCLSCRGNYIGKTLTLFAAEAEAGHIVHLARETVPEGLKRRYRVLLLTVEGPGSKLVVRGVGHGTGYKDAPAGSKGKDAVVLEKDCRLLRALLRRGKVLRGILHGGCSLNVYVRILKEAKENLYPQDVPYCVVYCGHFYVSAFDKLFKVGKEAVGHHVHVHSGVRRLCGNVLAVCAKAVVYHFSHGVPVRDHKAVKAPFAAEDVLYHEGVSGGGNAVVVVEGSHQSHGSGLYRSLEGRQVDVTELALCKVRAVVVASALAGAVSHEMLDTGGHGGGVQLQSLVAAHHGFRHAGVKVSVFSTAFRDAAPAGVARYVQHGREGPPDTLCGCFQGSHPGSCLYQGGVKGGGQSQRDWKYRVETVNHVTGHKKRNTQTGLFHADALEFIDLDGVHLVQDGTYASRTEGVGIIGHVCTGGNLVHLANLLGQGHL